MVFYPQFCTYHAIQYLLFSGISVVFILSVRCWNNKYLFIYLFYLFTPSLPTAHSLTPYSSFTHSPLCTVPLPSLIVFSRASQGRRQDYSNNSITIITF